MQKNSQNWRTYKGFVSKIHKKLLKPNNKKTNNPVKTCAKGLNRHFSRKDIQTTNKHMKRYLASLTIRERQIKTTMRNHFIPTGITLIKKIDTKFW